MASRVLDKKLKKVLDMRTDTPALLESLEAISTLFSDHNSSSAPAGGAAAGDGEKAGGGGHEYSTLDARRSLREDLERQVCLQAVYTAAAAAAAVLDRSARELSICGIGGVDTTNDTLRCRGRSQQQ